MPLEEAESIGLKRITKQRLKDLCKKHKLYMTPSLNDVLYLHFQGFSDIECLEEYTGLKCLWLESNAITKLEGLENQKELKCLFIHNNLIKKIENLEHCRQLDNINLSYNQLTYIDNCGIDILPVLTNLNLSYNYLNTADSIRHLTNCKMLSVLDLSHNRIDDILVVKIFASMSELRVLILQGNPVVNLIPSYRKTLILECIKLTYLDSRPVFPKDRACAEAWKRGGYEEERRERQDWNKKEQRKIRDSVNAVLSFRNRGSGEPSIDLITSSDEDDQICERISAPSSNKIREEVQPLTFAEKLKKHHETCPDGIFCTCLSEELIEEGLDEVSSDELENENSSTDTVVDAATTNNLAPEYLVSDNDENNINNEINDEQIENDEYSNSCTSIENIDYMSETNRTITTPDIDNTKNYLNIDKTEELIGSISTCTTLNPKSEDKDSVVENEQSEISVLKNTSEKEITTNNEIKEVKSIEKENASEQTTSLDNGKSGLSFDLENPIHIASAIKNSVRLAIETEVTSDGCKKSISKNENPNQYKQENIKNNNTTERQYPNILLSPKEINIKVDQSSTGTPNHIDLQENTINIIKIVDKCEQNSYKADELQNIPKECDVKREYVLMEHDSNLGIQEIAADHLSSQNDKDDLKIVENCLKLQDNFKIELNKNKFAIELESVETENANIKEKSLCDVKNESKYEKLDEGSPLNAISYAIQDVATEKVLYVNQTYDPFLKNKTEHDRHVNELNSCNIKLDECKLVIKSENAILEPKLMLEVISAEANIETGMSESTLNYKKDIYTEGELLVAAFEKSADNVLERFEDEANRSLTQLKTEYDNIKDTTIPVVPIENEIVDNTFEVSLDKFNNASADNDKNIECIQLTNYSNFDTTKKKQQLEIAENYDTWKNSKFNLFQNKENSTNDNVGSLLKNSNALIENFNSSILSSHPSKTPEMENPDPLNKSSVQSIATLVNKLSSKEEINFDKNGNQEYVTETNNKDSINNVKLFKGLTDDQNLNFSNNKETKIVNSLERNSYGLRDLYIESSEKMLNIISKSPDPNSLNITYQSNLQKSKTNLIEVLKEEENNFILSHVQEKPTLNDLLENKNVQSTDKILENKEINFKNVVNLSSVDNTVGEIFQTNCKPKPDFSTIKLVNSPRYENIIPANFDTTNKHILKKKIEEISIATENCSKPTSDVIKQNNNEIEVHILKNCSEIIVHGKTIKSKSEIGCKSKNMRPSIDPITTESIAKHDWPSKTLNQEDMRGCDTSQQSKKITSADMFSKKAETLPYKNIYLCNSFKIANSGRFLRNLKAVFNKSRHRYGSWHGQRLSIPIRHVKRISAPEQGSKLLNGANIMTSWHVQNLNKKFSKKLKPFPDERHVENTLSNIHYIQEDYMAYHVLKTATVQFYAHFKEHAFFSVIDKL